MQKDNVFWNQRWPVMTLRIPEAQLEQLRADEGTNKEQPAEDLNTALKEWKVQDVWTAENIDFYRLAFMIKGDLVLMPDLK